MRWAALVLVGCGRVAFDPATDAVLDETRCAWSEPEPLTALNTTAEESEPALSPDGRTLVFTLDRPGGDDLYQASFDGVAWSPRQLIGPLDSPAGQGGAAWSPAGDALYFTSFRDGPLGFYVATYEGGEFGAPTRVPGLEGLSEQLAPTVRGDHLEMFYSSRLSPSTIQRAVRPDATAPWVPAGEVTELDGPRDVGYPGVSADGLVLYYEATQPGGRFTIVRAVRPSLAAPFGPPEIVTALDGGRNDGDPQPSADGSRIVFTSDRARSGDYDLYLATRVCP